MAQIVKNQENNTSIVYSKYEEAKLFSCLPPETQEELLSIMREMVKKNK